MAKINWSNISTAEQLLESANTASDGSYWVSMFYMSWVIMVIILISWGWELALLVASFIFFIFGIILAYTGLMAWGWVIPPFATILFMFLYITYSGKTRRL